MELQPAVCYLACIVQHGMHNAVYMKTATSNNKLPLHNRELAGIFHQMGNCYRFAGNTERFRAIAYENISRRLLNMKEDIAVYAGGVQSLDNIGGIGKSIAAKIMEYLRTGRVQAFEKLKKTIPFDLLELMDHTGIGPAVIQLLYKKVHTPTREALADAIAKNELRNIKGLGQQKINILMQALKMQKPGERLPYATAYKTGNLLLQFFLKTPGVIKASLAGSLRRKKSTIGDIDIVVAALPASRKKIAAAFLHLPQVQKVLAGGSTKLSVLLQENIQVDVRLVNDYEYGAAMLYFTGSREHNIKLRTMARARGYKINEYGLFDNVTGKRLAGATEAEMYAALHLHYIPPEKRLDKGEIENAMIR